MGLTAGVGLGLAAWNSKAGQAEDGAVVKPSAAPVKVREDFPGTIIVDASDFVHRIPRDQRFVDAAILDVPWLYNNTALKLEDKISLYADIEAPEEGTYHLFVRSMGQGGSFRIGVGDDVPDQLFGDGELGWRKGGSFDLQRGRMTLAITCITPGSVFDALVLSKNASFSEDDLKAHQLPADIEMMHEYRIPGSSVKFGDITGDGKADFMAIEPDWSVHVYNHEGKELWRYKAPDNEGDLRRRFEPPGTIWDFNQDGKGEVLHWRMIEGQEYLVMAEGRTGKIIKKTPWPVSRRPHAYRNFKTAVAKLHHGYPNDIVVLSDSGYSGDGRSADVIRAGAGTTMTITAYDANLNMLWQHNESRARDHLGHYPYPRDIDGDGLDEVVVGHLVLDTNGRVRWSHLDMFDHNYDHCDSVRFADVNGDGKLDILTPTSDVGVMARDARTGEIFWKHTSEHGQQLEVGNFLAGVSAPQIAVTARFYGKDRTVNLASQLHWFDPQGNFIKTWPANPIEGNLDAVKGDWCGDGDEHLFWHKFKINERGEGELCFYETVYHMFDFNGDGADEVIAKSKLGQDEWIMRVYGSKSARRSPSVVKHDPEYLRHRMANHTHY